MAKLPILIVEDESLIAFEIQRIVVDSGYAIAAVFSEVMAAEDFLRSGMSIDAALVDVVVRDQHAYGLCKALDQQEIPFGFVTGLPRCELKKRWRDRPYVEKPFTARHIESLLHELTESHLVLNEVCSNRS